MLGRACDTTPVTTPSSTGPEPARSLVGALMLCRVTGRSMEPTLRDGDVLLARRAETAGSGALVVVRWPGDRPVSVKRLVARDAAGWWVERDSAYEGTDSWSVGAVPLDGLLAVVVARVWPHPRRFGPGDLRTPGRRGPA